MALTIQARLLGYFTHGMGGIYRDRIEKLARARWNKIQVIMGFALGKLAPKNLLPAELQEKENPQVEKCRSYMERSINIEFKIMANKI